MPRDSLRPLRRGIADLDVAIERLHLEQQCDADTMRMLLDDLDSINADLHVALEELTACPPTPADGEAEMKGAGGTGPTP